MEQSIYLTTILSIAAFLGVCLVPVLQWVWRYNKAVQYQKHSIIPGPPPSHWLKGKLSKYGLNRSAQFIEHHGFASQHDFAD